MLLAVLFLGEELRAYHLVALALIVPGVVLATARRLPRQFRRTSMSSLPPADLEAEYNNRARVPEYPEIMAGWERDAAAYRQARRHRAELGLRYGPHPRQTIDIFHADAPEDAAPLVVFIHGGYWRSLEPSLFSHMAAGANAHGFSVAVPGYRLCPEVDVADIIDGRARSACLFLHRPARQKARRLRPFGRRTPDRRHGGDRLGQLGKAAPGDLAAPRPGRFGRVRSGAAARAPRSTRRCGSIAPAPSGRARPSGRFRPGSTLEPWVGETESAEFIRQSRDVADRWSAAGARTSLAIVPGRNHFDVRPCRSPIRRAR